MFKDGRNVSLPFVGRFFLSTPSSGDVYKANAAITQFGSGLFGLALSWHFDESDKLKTVTGNLEVLLVARTRNKQDSIVWRFSFLLFSLVSCLFFSPQFLGSMQHFHFNYFSESCVFPYTSLYVTYVVYVLFICSCTGTFCTRQIYLKTLKFTLSLKIP